MSVEKVQKAAQTVACQCLAGRVRKLSRVITSLYDRALQPYGITVNQASILTTLVAGGEATPSQIGARLQMEKSTVSRTLERMRNSGLVESGTGTVQTVRITDAGNRLLVESHDAWQDAQNRATKLVGDDGAQALIRIVERLKDAR